MTGINRRRLLKTASLSALGLLLTTAASPTALAGSPRTWELSPRSAALRALDADRQQYVPVGPLSITATHSLSSDAFVTSQLTLDLLSDTPDQIVPITRSDGRVEALVLSTRDSLLYLLHRDPTVPGGWLYDAVYDPNDVGKDDYTISMFTAAFNPTDGNVHILVRKVDHQNGDFLSVEYMGQDNVVRNSQMTDYTLNGSSNGGWWGYASSHLQPRFYLDANNIPSFYLWDRPDVYYTIDFQVAPNQQPVATLNQQLVEWGDPTTDSGAIFFAGGTVLTASAWGGVDGVLNVQWITDRGSFEESYLTGSKTTVWAGAVPTPAGLMPLIVQEPDRGGALSLDYLTFDGFDLSQNQLILELPDNAAPTSITASNNPAASQLYFVLGGDDATTDQLWTAMAGLTNEDVDPVAIPIDSGYSAVFAPQLLTDDVTIFGVLTDGSVRVLTRADGSTSPFYAEPGNGVSAPDNPSDGPWASVPVHLPAQTATALDTWRTAIQVRDAFGAPQVGAQLQVTVDRDVTVWQAGGTDFAGQTLPTATVLVAGAPATVFTTDVDGELNLATPVSALHTATYTITASDGTVTTLAPDGGVHAQLADLTTLPQAMQNAQAADGSPLFGALGGPTGDGTASPAAVQAATFVAQAMSAGLGLPLPSAQVTVAIGGLASASTLRLSASGLTRPTGVGSLRSWWERAKHDAESVVHGIEKAVVQVADDVENAASVVVLDAENKIYQISLQIAGAIDDVVSYVITDARSAVAAITGVFHALLQDVDKGLDDIVHWLKDDVLSLFSDALKASSAMADLVLGSDADAQLQAVLSRWRTAEDAAFDDLAQEVTAVFGQVSTYLSGRTVSSLRAEVPAPSVQAGRTSATAEGTVLSGTALTQALADCMHDVRGQWLRDKLKHQSTGAPVVDDVVGAALDRLVDDLGAGIATLLENFRTVAEAAVGLSPDGSQDGVTNGDLGSLFTDVGDYVTAVLGLARQLLDDLLDLLQAIWNSIRATLSQTLDQVFPAARPLLDLIGAGDVSVAELLGLLITLPGTLFARVRFGGTATMFSTTSSAEFASAGSDQDWTSFIGTAGLLSTFFWGALDGSVDVLRMAAQSEGQKYQPPNFVAWTDLGFSFFSNLISYPFKSTNPLSWTPGPGTTKYPNLPVGVWAAGFGPAVTQYIGAWASQNRTDDQQTLIGRVQTCIVSGIGIALTVLDAYTTWKTAPSRNEDASRTVAVVGNLTNVMSPLGLLADETFAISDVVKAVFDIACPIIVFGSNLALLETG